MTPGHVTLVYGTILSLLGGKGEWCRDSSTLLSSHVHGILSRAKEVFAYAQWGSRYVGYDMGLPVLRPGLKVVLVDVHGIVLFVLCEKGGFFN